MGATLKPRRLWKTAEAIAWAVGIVCVVYAAAQYADHTISSRRLLQQFAAVEPPGHRPFEEIGTTDVALWSPARIEAWRTAWTRPGPPPLAVLRIPRLHLEAPVLEGTDDTTLNRALGHIEDTPLPGVNGNSGIAGHRDGFFRVLKDVAPGDILELKTRRGDEIYRIERTWIVSPDDVSVLNSTPGQSITLVTCYPFYFVGPAPQRFIVRAVRAEGTARLE